MLYHIYIYAYNSDITIATTSLDKYPYLFDHCSKKKTFTSSSFNVKVLSSVLFDFTTCTPRKTNECPLKINGCFRCISYWHSPFLRDDFVSFLGCTINCVSQAFLPCLFCGGFDWTGLLEWLWHHTHENKTHHPRLKLGGFFFKAKPISKIEKKQTMEKHHSINGPWPPYYIPPTVDPIFFNKKNHPQTHPTRTCQNLNLQGLGP